MTLAFHQPNFLPNLGFFYKMSQADVFVIITNINFGKRDGWQRRHKIPGPSGDIWLTVPVKGSQNSLIKEVAISEHGDWRRKHWKTLQLAYAHTPEQALLADIGNIYQKNWERLVDLNLEFIMLLKEALGVTTRVVVDEEVAGEKENLMVNICKKHHADTYLSGLGGKHYMTDRHHTTLNQNGITCKFVEQDVTGSYPYSAAHYLLSEGKEKTRAML